MTKRCRTSIAPVRTGEKINRSHASLQFQKSFFLANEFVCMFSATEEPEQCSGFSEIPDDDDLSLVSDSEEMDLLGEIFDTLSAQSSREPGLLYSTRSLDFFGSDSSEFISRVRRFNNNVPKPVNITRSHRFHLSFRGVWPHPVRRV